MSSPSGKQLCFPRRSRGKDQDSRENKTNCFPLDLTLSVYYFMILTNLVLHTELSIC